MFFLSRNPVLDRKRPRNGFEIRCETLLHTSTTNYFRQLTQAFVSHLETIIKATLEYMQWFKMQQLVADSCLVSNRGNHEVQDMLEIMDFFYYSKEVPTPHPVICEFEHDCESSK